MAAAAKMYLALTIAALAATSALGKELLQAGGCPIDPATRQLDFSGVAASCGDSSTICTTCICALVDVFTPALVAGGVAVNTTDPSSFPLDQSANIIRQCAEQYLVSMLQANVNVTSLSSLSECAFDAPSSVPPCLAAQVADIRPGVNNTAFSPEATKNSTKTAGAAPAATTAPAAPADTKVTASSRTDSPPEAAPAAAAPAAAPPAQPAAPASSAASATSLTAMAGGALLLAALML